jgi:hypothetical protein
MPATHQNAGDAGAMIMRRMGIPDIVTALMVAAMAGGPEEDGALSRHAAGDG